MLFVRGVGTKYVKTQICDTHYTILLSPFLPKFIRKDVFFSVILALEKLVISFNKVDECI